MAWGRLDDQALDNEKLMILSDPAWRMWGSALIYCQAKLTNGFIPEHVIERLGVRAKNKTKVVNELCAVLIAGKKPLWHRVTGGYQVNDYLDWNDSREKVLKAREAVRERVRKHRGNHSRSDEPNALQPPQESHETPLPSGRAFPRSTIHDPQKPERTEESSPAFDVWFDDLCRRYPKSRLNKSRLAQGVFIAILSRQPDGPEAGFLRMVANLEWQKRSAQWRDGRVPRMDRWLEMGTWEDGPPAAPVMEDTACGLCVNGYRLTADGKDWERDEDGLKVRCSCQTQRVSA